MKKIAAILTLAVFFISLIPISIADENDEQKERLDEKKEKLKEIQRLRRIS